MAEGSDRVEPCVSVNPYPLAGMAKGSDRVELYVSVNPYPSAGMAEGSDRVELRFHVLLLGFCNFLHAKDGY